MSHIENPRFSATIDHTKLRRAIFLPDSAQKASSSGSQRSIHFDSTPIVMLDSLADRSRARRMQEAHPAWKGRRTRPRTPQLSFRLDVVGARATAANCVPEAL